MATKERTLFSVKSDWRRKQVKNPIAHIEPKAESGKKTLWVWSYHDQWQDIVCADEFRTKAEALADVREFHAELVKAAA